MTDLNQQTNNAGMEGIDIGIPYGEAKGIHLNSLYDIRRRIAAIIENAGVTNSAINYQAIEAEVDLAISLIPDIEQGNKCRRKYKEWEEQELEEIMKIHKREMPTTDDRNDAKRAASMAVLQLVQVIFDDDIGIRKRHTVGLA